MTDKYILSFQSLQLCKHTKCPPWWAPWRGPVSHEKLQWINFSITLTEEEGATFMKHREPILLLVSKCLGALGLHNFTNPRIRNLQLEEIPKTNNRTPSEYVQTAEKQPPCNLL